MSVMASEDNWFVRYWWVVALAALGAGAITTAAAAGFPILELEFAWTAQGADEVLAGTDLDAVRATILWDFVFLVLYASALSLGSLWASGVFTSDRLRQAGPYVAIGALAAGIFDVIENLAMLGYLNGWFGFAGWPMVAGLMAVPKFLLVLVAIIYILMGIGVSIAGWLRRQRTS
jgi:hypothetical protein